MMHDDADLPRNKIIFALPSEWRTTSMFISLKQDIGLMLYTQRHSSKSEQNLTTNTFGE